MTDGLAERVSAAIGDHYKLSDEIGRGGMSVVFRAHDQRLNRVVAVKVLPPELAYDPAIRLRFMREAQTSAHLSHPNIVPIYDVGDVAGIAYFVMAYVEGGNLAARLARDPRPPLDDVRRMLSEIAEALGYAHERGVIHRDIKPDNILLDIRSSRAVVTDFGIARAMEAGTRLTNTGMAVGTPAYMSPEQAVGERQIDGRADIYSLGVLAYQMIAGRVPFNAGNPMALLMKHVSEPPRPLSELRPDIPRSVSDAIERALMKSPDNRWPTASSFRDALLSDKTPAGSWRVESREAVRYTSPKRLPAAQAPKGARTADRGATNVIEEPPHLAGFTPEQRADIRLWHGRIHILDRIKQFRWYAVGTVAMYLAAMGGIVAMVDAEFPPLILAPIVPIYMSRKLWRRALSLRGSGVRVRRALLMPRAKWVIPSGQVETIPAKPTQKQLEKLATIEVLESEFGPAVRRAADDRAAILDIIAGLSKADRKLLPDVVPTVHALVERVVSLAQMVHRLDPSVDDRLLSELDKRISASERGEASPDGDRQLQLLKRQRETLQDLLRRRGVLVTQLENAGMALVNLRLDMVKLRSSGLQSALSDVNSATQEARALSRDIAAVLEAADEVRAL